MSALISKSVYEAFALLDEMALNNRQCLMDRLNQKKVVRVVDMDILITLQAQNNA